MKRGFTLMELLLVVLIIGVLTAVAMPQYKRAVLKSRYSTLMPIGKSIAQGNEVYYLGNGEYTTQRAMLDIEDQANDPQGTTVELATDPEYLSYVRVANTAKVPHARYVVYQKHSANFADTTMCEAKDDTGKDLCKILGGVYVSDNGTDTGWTSYILSGKIGAGDSFSSAEENGLAGPPVCTTYSGKTTCTYTYTTGETLTERDYMQPLVYDSSTGTYGTGSTSPGSNVSAGKITENTTAYYDTTGNLEHIAITGEGFTFRYDANGQFLGASTLFGATKGGIPNASDVDYDADGNVRVARINDTQYLYFKDGRVRAYMNNQWRFVSNYPDVSDYNLFTIDSASARYTSATQEAQTFVGKTKCDMYPDMQECPKED